jgi:CHAT domain-containing protein
MVMNGERMTHWDHAKIALSLAVIFSLSCVESQVAHAQSARPSLQDSFRLGSGGGVLCQMQTKSHDPAISSIFDRAWTLICRDAAKPIGKIYAIRNIAFAKAALDKTRNSEMICQNGSENLIPDIGRATIKDCQLKDAQIGYRIITVSSGKITYLAEGLAGYDSALKLGLRTIIEDKIVPGKVTVAIGANDDPRAFARVQAGTLDVHQALAEGYRRNNSGNYAEAAEFFGALQTRTLETGKDQKYDHPEEYLVNHALQISNLGEFEEASSMFAKAEKTPSDDRVQSRLRRNFAAIHFINQAQYADALARLNQPVAPNLHDQFQRSNTIEIGAALAAEINAGVPVGKRLGVTESSALTPEERADFLDAQALQLEGTLLRLQGKSKEALAVLEKSYSDVIRVRDGRVLSVIRLRAQILAEIGLALEVSGDTGGGATKLREALTLLETRYPETASVNGARARLASYLARHGQDDEALALYKALINSAVANRLPTTGMSNMLSPYFEILSKRSAERPELIDDMFLAAQTLVRPGVADTQATLARQLSSGNDDAARLFRQSQTLSRDIERSRIELANIVLMTKPSADQQRAANALRVDLSALTAQQVETQAQLSTYAQFRVVSQNAISLKEIQKLLGADEAYLKTVTVADSLYAIYVTSNYARAWPIPMSNSALEAAVGALRETIVTQENGQQQIYPFDLAGSHALFVALLNPVSTNLASVHHLLFEPDGALLKLPINLLVTDQASVEAYTARIAIPDADQFDFRNVRWLGRERTISTMVSVRGFSDSRSLQPSHALKQYLGFGANQTPNASVSSQRGECDWPLAAWDHPVAKTELNVAQTLIGSQNAYIISGASFTDQAILARDDLAQYRILHFATHGLVTAPKPQCHANPALLTSFGMHGSDGLLSFTEIYGLKLDADIIILSACNTASAAGLTATRNTGLTTGGANALDGLVRAFVGAGGRTVLATHWPASDDFHATERLIGDLFRAPAGTSIADAMLSAETALMDDPVTSHPYYWSGFAIVGDGTKPLLISR